jgi:hypothetical protein
MNICFNLNKIKKYYKKMKNTKNIFKIPVRDFNFYGKPSLKLGYAAPFNLLIDVKLFSTSSILLANVGDNNNDSSSESNQTPVDGNSNNQSLPRAVKSEIAGEVDHFYFNEVPKFKEPDIQKLRNERFITESEAEDAHSKFVTKHDEAAAKIATQEKQRCIDSVSENIKQQHPNCSPEKIQSYVEKDAERRFLGAEAGRDHLPGQTQWYYERIDEGSSADVENGVANVVRAENEDEGFGHGDHDKYSGKIEDQQSLAGSPGFDPNDKEEA